MEKKKKRAYTKKPQVRPTKYEGFDFFKDQLDTIDELAKKLETTKISILRSIIDNALQLPKTTKDE